MGEGSDARPSQYDIRRNDGPEWSCSCGALSAPLSPLDQRPPADACCMPNPGGSETAADLPISVDPLGARIDYSVALVSLPSHWLWDELWSGVGIPQCRPFRLYLIRSLTVSHEGDGRPIFPVSGVTGHLMAMLRVQRRGTGSRQSS
jgi:hypothetical protein